MALRHLTPEMYRRMPWANGLGVTTEIARFPETDEPFHWRASVADVTVDGPFSAFEGCDRIIAVIDGRGMILEHPRRHQSVSLGPLEPYSFSGDWETVCHLRGGPVRDFNIITRRGLATAVLSILQLDDAPEIDIERAKLVYCISGTAVLGEGTELRTDETILAGADDALRLRASGGRAVVAVVTSS